MGRQSLYIIRKTHILDQVSGTLNFCCAVLQKQTPLEALQSHSSLEKRKSQRRCAKNGSNIRRKSLENRDNHLHISKASMLCADWLTSSHLASLDATKIYQLPL